MAIEQDSERAVQEATTFHQLNQDLSQQIQTLLSGTSRSSSTSTSVGSSADDVISSKLVPFADAQQLQQRNVQLLHVVHSLARDPDAAGKWARAAPSQPKTSHLADDQHSKEDAALAKVLRRTLQELKDQREGRAAAEDQWQLAARQRDSYKGLLPSSILDKVQVQEQAEWNSGSDLHDNATGGAQSENPTNAMGANNTAATAMKHLQLQLNASQTQLAQAQVERDQTLSRVNASLSAARDENARLRTTEARATAEARELQEGKQRSDRAASSARTECAVAMQARLELEALLVTAQQRVQVCVCVCVCVSS